MAAFNFPNSPFAGQKHEENGITYEWTGKVWNIFTPPDDTEHQLRNKVNRSGDYMQGQLLAQPGEPTDPNSMTSQAWQKRKFVQDAPSDGVYGRRGGAGAIGDPSKPTAEDGTWEKTESFIDAPQDGIVYGRKDQYWTGVPEEAPREPSHPYARRDGNWVISVTKEEFDASQLNQDIAIDRKVNTGGDWMTGPLGLVGGDPVDPNHAAPKHYVDKRTGVQEAPDDGKAYARTNPTGEGAANATWVETITREELNQPAHDLRRKVNRDGDTMLAPLILPPGNPTHGYEASHKNYVDTKLEEAPNDGLAYVRINESWEPVPEELAQVPIALDRKVDRAGDHMLGELLAVPGEPVDPNAMTSNAWQKQNFIQEAPADDRLYGRKGAPPVAGSMVTAEDGKWEPIGIGINDAPQDGIVYGRMDANWVESVAEAPYIPNNFYARNDGNWALTIGKEVYDAKVSEIEFHLRNKVAKAGDTMSGPLTLMPSDPTHGYHATHKNYVDARVGTIFTELEPPANPNEGTLWWDEDTGGLYVFYTDADSSQWVQVNGTQGGGVSASLDSAPVDDIVYGFRNKQWTPVHSAVFGDVKNGFQTSDHAGWIKLDGRAVSSLSVRQQQQALALGFTTNLPNASNVVAMQGGATMGAISGSMSRSVTIAQGNLPNVTLTAGSAGAHTHTTDSQGNHTHTTDSQPNFSMGTGPSRGRAGVGNSGYYYTDAEGGYHQSIAHTHIAQSAGAHTHTAASAGAHTHNVPLGGSGTALSFNVTPQTMTVNVFCYLGL